MPFYLQPDSFPKSSFMNRSIYPEDWMHFPRTPNEYILFLVQDGVLYIREDNTDYELHSGDMLLLEPGRSHVGYQCSYVDYYFIHMPSNTFVYTGIKSEGALIRYFQQNKSNYLKANPFEYGLYDSCKPLIPKTMHLEPDAFHPICQKMEDVIRALTARDEFYKLICSKNMLDILICLSRFYTHQVLRSSSNPEISAKGDKRTEDILSFLQQNYHTKITGLELENRLHMNFDYLNRLFKTKFGLTIFEYLKIYRLNKSKELLLNSNMKIYEIAALTGFPNEYHFNRVFTNVVGITPGKYRRNM